MKTSRKEAQLGKQTGTKILVRNVPFQANRQEIQDIFAYLYLFLFCVICFFMASRGKHYFF